MSEQTKEDQKSCCGCKCSGTKVAEFLRHLAEFFEKQK